MKVSKNKNKILEILKNINKPVNVNYIHKELNKEAKVDLSTVYRCINNLCKEDIIIKEMRNDKMAYYSLNFSGHSHEIVCNICKESVNIDTCPITELTKQIEEKTGFNITNHSIHLNGICKKCSEVKNKKI